MDSYDLFGDDVSGSVLDGLPDLGSEAFGDSSATGPGNYFILIGLFLLKFLRPVYIFYYHLRVICIIFLASWQ